MPDRNLGKRRNRNRDDLEHEFRECFDTVFEKLERLGHQPRLLEGLRTAERQAYLYAQGRTRSGNKVTGRDGYKRKSRHQARELGRGGEASDLAFDHHPDHVCTCGKGARKRTVCWDGDSLAYRQLGALAEEYGLVWGGRFGIKGHDRYTNALKTPRVGWDPGHIEAP